jgi:hypothetical protein
MRARESFIAQETLLLKVLNRSWVKNLLFSELVIGIWTGKGSEIAGLCLNPMATTSCL